MQLKNLQNFNFNILIIELLQDCYLILSFSLYIQLQLLIRETLVINYCQYDWQLLKQDVLLV